MDLSSLLVSISAGNPEYPKQAPFNPPKLYPELPYPTATDENNEVYSLVRESMRLLEMDTEHDGNHNWNPLGEIISPGDRVLIKPNFVLDRNYGNGPIEAVVTHASVLRAIADYVLIALKGRGQLMIGDAPQMNCQWANLLIANGIGPLSEHLQKVSQTLGIPYSLRDFRKEETEYRYTIVWKRKPLSPLEGRTVTVDLGNESLMENIDTDRLYGADYDRSQIVRAHRGHHHRYRIAREVLEADVVISVPKLKVHSKVGTTLNIKNLVGINTDKNHLAHYRIGSPASGGDEFSNPRWDDLLDRWLSDRLLLTAWHIGKYPFALWRGFRKVMRKIFPTQIPSFAFGNWSGNDTAWRMALDLNRVLLTADGDGKVHEEPQRKYFSFIDGIVGGQRNGPLSPDPYPSGVILAGANPLAVDWVATRLMGLDPERIPMYRNASSQLRKLTPNFEVDGIRVRSNRAEWEDLLRRADSIFRFLPATGWRGQIESRGSQTLENAAPEFAEAPEVQPGRLC
jgi:uncharacterized protein (DUF362 family)